MSLNKLLSVGRSFAGIRDEKSPFEMRKECLLPIFEPSLRLASKAEPAKVASDGGALQADWLKHESLEASKIGPAAGPATAAAPGGSVRPKSAGQRSLWSILTFGIFDRKPAPGVSLSSALIQPELSLDRVRVMRNDLHDSDLELVLKKRPQARKASVAASSPFAAGLDSAGTRPGGAPDRSGTALKI